MREITTGILANIKEPFRVREDSSCFFTLSSFIENVCFFSKGHDEAKTGINKVFCCFFLLLVISGNKIK